ncbi:MAG: hypothetical protein EON98_11330, partial [Chitinophagaceae bacterium]
MKHLSTKHFVPLLSALLICVASCKKSDVAPPPTPPAGGGNTGGTDTVTILKNATTLPIGIAIDYSLFRNNATYRNTVVREADQVTFAYNMKHGAIVKDDGSFDYTQADELFNMASAAGLEVYGHTLAWHENQNGNYLRSLTVGTADPNAPNLLPSGDFEAGTGTSG